MMDEATEAQNAAADPRFSTWLSANAGSGKTRVLTDRVARLLLCGTEPQNILCLTYTKAAANEMQNRLFKRLGRWAMMNDEDLRGELRALGETPPDSLEHARTLFARAIDAPGGLKIRTIHSFCSSILRQFPLESCVSPQFRELDDAGQKAVVDDVIDKLAAARDPSLGPISRIASDETLTDVALSIAGQRKKFERRLSRADIYSMFDAPTDMTIEDVVMQAVSRDDLKFLKEMAPILSGSDAKRDQELGAAFNSLSTDPGITVLRALESKFVFKSGDRAGQARIGEAPPSKALRDGPMQSLMERLNELMERVAEARRLRLSLEAASNTFALHDFAHAFLKRYRSEKSALGVLDFDDLIEKTAQLLTTRSLEWVLYRLDSGIDHILVDEAQDTSPQQWDVIDALAREITAGQGARQNRTLFVVGDKKQSIYSFQGADAAEFDRMHQTFRDRLKAGPALQSRELHFSFRSSSAILSTVDALFDASGASGLGGAISHRAFHPSMPGRVDIWPLVPAASDDETPEWFDPVDRIAADDPKIKLAGSIAEKITELVGTETITGENGAPRLVTAGDFLILVQGRGPLFEHIIRACKARGLPIAGADRLKLRAELAVRDLLALLSVLALQEDSLSLATVLRSPLFGWSEKTLYDLAQGRKQTYLWAELRDRRADFPETYSALNALLRQVDFLRPYELLEFILTRFEGRKKLLARLGPEAEDGIDELLNQALVYERDGAPSLTGFVARAQSEEVEVKRQLDGTGDMIRVMTVHGAKGLESPIVILPDTTRQERSNRNPILIGEDNVPVWRMPSDNRPEQLAGAVDAAAAADKEERRRLLYVAMTRAESWLVVCGADTRRSGDNWYGDISSTFETLPHRKIETPTGQGLRMSHGTWPSLTVKEAPVSVTKPSVLADYLNEPVRPTTAIPSILAPSDLGGAKALAGGAKEEEAALRYGRQIHRLLELLPKSDRSWSAARRILEGGPDPVEEGEIDGMRTEALSVIEAHPELFRPEALVEVDIAAHLSSLNRQMSGTIDRLLIANDKIMAIDFKTNEIVPASPEAVPEGILRQMGAYLEALQQIYPDREIELSILWTATAELTRLPHGIVRNALANTTTS
ncbi:MAG: double-strand break repair helicase AddA [Silicimonas sp.]|nr:double-strand break repair helicase AddA [Silicimonas sp.]